MYLPRCEYNMVPVVDLSLLTQNPQFVFFHHDDTALLLPSILAPLIAAVVSVVAVISVFTLVCVALCLQFRITTPTNSFLTNPLLFHSL